MEEQVSYNADTKANTCGQTPDSILADVLLVTLALYFHDSIMWQKAALELLDRATDMLDDQQLDKLFESNREASETFAEYTIKLMEEGHDINTLLRANEDRISRVVGTD